MPCILGLPAATRRSKNPPEERVEPDGRLDGREQGLPQAGVPGLRQPGPLPDAGPALALARGQPAVGGRRQGRRPAGRPPAARPGWWRPSAGRPRGWTPAAPGRPRARRWRRPERRPGPGGGRPPSPGAGRCGRPTGARRGPGSGRRAGPCRGRPPRSGRRSAAPGLALPGLPGWGLPGGRGLAAGVLGDPPRVGPVGLVGPATGQYGVLDAGRVDHADQRPQRRLLGPLWSYARTGPTCGWPPPRLAALARAAEQAMHQLTFEQCDGGCGRGVGRSEGGACVLWRTAGPDSL
jgi:hypothetical protein